jgi:prephenate dehydrogenase
LEFRRVLVFGLWDLTMSDSRQLPVIQPGTGQPPIFDKIAIVGLGLIGGSIALAARQIWPSGLVIAVDTKDVLEQAMVRHAIDVAADDLVVAAEADLVILAAPVRENLRLLEALDEHISGNAVVTDVGSTKRDIVAAASCLPPRFTFVGGHPMGGAARGGFAHAREDLFKGRPWIFTPQGDGAAEVLGKLYDFASALGAVPRSMDAAAHDRLLAYLSHLPQLAVTALMTTVGESAGAAGLALAGRGLVDTTRLASSPVDIWRDVCATNADQIRPALDALIERLAALRDGLDDEETLATVFDDAGRWRDVLMKDRGN